MKAAIVGVLLLAAIVASSAQAFVLRPIAASVPRAVAQLLAKVLPPGRASPETGSSPDKFPRAPNVASVEMIADADLLSLDAQRPSIVRNVGWSTRLAVRSVWDPEFTTIQHIAFQPSNGPSIAQSCRTIDASTWSGKRELAWAIAQLVVRYGWRALPIRYVIWHVAVVSLVVLSANAFVKKREPTSRARLTSRNVVISAVLCAWIPSAVEFMYLVWWNFDNVVRTGAIPTSYACSLGSFGYAGVVVGGVCAHVIIVLCVLMNTSLRLKPSRPDADGRTPRSWMQSARVRLAVGAALVATLLCFPLILAWINRLLSDDIWLKYIPF